MSGIEIDINSREMERALSAAWWARVARKAINVAGADAGRDLGPLIAAT